MKNSELNGILNGIVLCGELKGIKFAYGLAKNHKIIMDEVSVFQKAVQPKKEFLDYDAKRLELCEKYSKKDKNQRPITENNKFVIDNQIEFDSELKKLQDLPENSKVLEAVDKQQKEFKEFLTKEISIKLFKIKFEDVPSDISVTQMKEIKELILEPV